MKLISVTPSQIPDVAALIHRAYRGESAKAGWTHEADLLDGQRTDEAALLSLIDDPQKHLLAAYEGEVPFACIEVEKKDASSVYLGMVTIDPGRQAEGLGRKLLEAGEDYARSLGADTAEMTVIVQRAELIAWYERRGYARTGERRPFPKGDPRFGLPKRDDLEFVVLEKKL